MTPKVVTRYSVNGPEGEFEPGSRGRVLRNLRGVRSAREMERLESQALSKTLERLVGKTGPAQRFHAADIRRMHRLWLEHLYPWAGQYRTVNISRKDFMFAPAGQIARLMEEFERGPLREFTPCRFAAFDDQAGALGVVHAELILIHPFREGNGRCARLLATLMGLQAGLPPLDFGGIRGPERVKYFGAIRAALDRDYGPITAVFSRVIARTLRASRRSRV